jgi:hypothetical protein
MKRKMIFVLVLSMTMLFQTRYALAEKGSVVKQPKGDAREIWHDMNITATVEAINVDTRMVTLRSGDNVISFTVDKKVKRLNEFKVGDKIRATYYISLATDIREPTLEEKKNPLVVLEGAGKAPPDATPAAGGLRQIRAVVTVEGIDRAAERVTLKGPRGKIVTVHVLDPSRLDMVSLGSTVIVTYTEALAVSLEKVQ